MAAPLNYRMHFFNYPAVFSSLHLAIEKPPWDFNRLESGITEYILTGMSLWQRRVRENSHVTGANNYVVSLSTLFTFLSLRPSGLVSSKWIVETRAWISKLTWCPHSSVFELKPFFSFESGPTVLQISGATLCSHHQTQTSFIGFWFPISRIVIGISLCPSQGTTSTSWKCMSWIIILSVCCETNWRNGQPRNNSI